MPPGGSGPYGAPPPAQHSNRTGIFVGVGIAGALALLLVLFLVIDGGGDDDNDPVETSNSSVPSEETLPPDDTGQTDTTAAPPEGGGQGGTGQGDTGDSGGDDGSGSGGGDDGGGSGEVPSSYSSAETVELENGLSIAEYGFSTTPDTYDEEVFYASYGVILENTGDALQEDVTLIVTAKAADGSTLGSTNHDIPFVDAGSTMAVGAVLDQPHAAISDLEFSFGGSSDGGSLGDGAVEFTDVTTVDNESSTDITFGANNTNNYAIDFPETTAILRDTDGGIIGGDTSIIALEDMPADSTSGGSQTLWMGFAPVDLDPEATEMWVFYDP